MKRAAPSSVVLAPVLVRLRGALSGAALAYLACSRTQHEARPSPATPLAPSMRPAAAAPIECPERVSAVEAAFSARSSCAVDSDCTAIWPGCPFGCYRTIQSDAVDEVWALIVKYNNHCAGCRYRCRILKGPATCEKGVCKNPTW